MNSRRENAFPSNKQVEGVVLVSAGNSSSNICDGKKKNNSSNSNIIVPAGCSSSSNRPWSILKDPRIVRVSRSLGGKDRHSKVRTIRGLRDRRVRLSVQTAIQLYELQDRLGLNQPSKVVDWLLAAAQQDIDKLPPLPLMPLDNFMHYAAAAAAASASAAAAAAHCHHHHQVLPTTAVDSSPTNNTTPPFQFAAANNHGSPHYPFALSSNKENALLLMGQTSTSTTSTNIDHQKNSWVRRNNNSIGEQGEQQQQHPQLQHGTGQQGLVPYASYYHWEASAANPCVGGVGYASSSSQTPTAGTDQELVLPHIALSSSSAGPHQLLLCPSFFPSYADLYDPKHINHFQMLNPPASHSPLPASHFHANRSRPAP